MPCNHLREILDVQAIILERRIKEYMCFSKISDEEEAKVDFIEKFGWLMRKLYCGFACKVRFDCEIAKAFLPKPPSETNSIFSDQLDLVRRKIIDEHIAEHKWFRHIEDDLAAQQDFLNEFDGIIREVICGFTCEGRFYCPNAREFFFPEEKEEEEKSNGSVTDNAH